MSLDGYRCLGLPELPWGKSVYAALQDSVVVFLHRILTRIPMHGLFPFCAVVCLHLFSASWVHSMREVLCGLVVVGLSGVVFSTGPCMDSYRWGIIFRSCGYDVGMIGPTAFIGYTVAGRQVHKLWKIFDILYKVWSCLLEGWNNPPAVLILNSPEMYRWDLLGQTII